MIPRLIENQIKKDLFRRKAIIIYGARQVGKTTLVRHLTKKLNRKTRYLNCDEPDIQKALTNQTSTQLRYFIGKADLVILDEAQQVSNIGKTIKLLVDTFPNLQVIATGSSSFQLSSKIAEPLTGRSFSYTLFPIAEKELVQYSNPVQTQRTLEFRLRYGNYPEILETADETEKRRLLKELKDKYLLKDVLNLGVVRDDQTLYSLLQALALQIGQEVSLNELASLIGIDKKTVKRYLNVLEETFIIFRLRAFSRNLRKEIGKKSKIFFYDLGLRNSLINNFNPLHLRNDVGQLWENYFITERLKFNHYKRSYTNMYFWRTYDQQEIDLIEETAGRLTAFEIKWRRNKTKLPKIFQKTYPHSQFQLVNQDNYLDFLI